MEGVGEVTEATGQVDGLYGVEAVRGLVGGGPVVVRQERIVRWADRLPHVDGGRTVEDLVGADAAK